MRPKPGLEARRRDSGDKNEGAECGVRKAADLQREAPHQAAIRERDGALASAFTNAHNALAVGARYFDGQRKRNTARMSYPRLHPMSGQSN